MLCQSSALPLDGRALADNLDDGEEEEIGCKTNIRPLFFKYYLLQIEESKCIILQDLLNENLHSMQ